MARSLSTIIVTSPGKSTRRLPAQHLAGLGRVTDEQVDLGGTEEARVLDDVLLPVVDADVGERQVEELSDRVRLAGRHDVVVGLGLLHHPPHRVHVVAGEAPVAAGVEVAEGEGLLQPQGDPRDGDRDLPGHELRPTTRRLVVEQDARRRVHSVGLAVVDRHVVAEDLGHAVGGPRPEERALLLGYVLDLAEHLRARGLVEAHLARVVVAVEPDRLEDVEDTLGGDVRRQHGVLPRVRHEGDRPEVVDLVGPGLLHGPHQRGEVREVAGEQRDVGHRRMHEVALRVVLTADQTVDVVALVEEELREVEAVLTGDPGDERTGMGREPTGTGEGEMSSPR